MKISKMEYGPLPRKLEIKTTVLDRFPDFHNPVVVVKDNVAMLAMPSYTVGKISARPCICKNCGDILDGRPKCPYCGYEHLETLPRMVWELDACLSPKIQDYLYNDFQTQFMLITMQATDCYIPLVDINYTNISKIGKLEENESLLVIGGVSTLTPYFPAFTYNFAAAVIPFKCLTSRIDTQVIWPDIKYRLITNG